MAVADVSDELSGGLGSSGMSALDVLLLYTVADTVARVESAGAAFAC